MRNSTVGLIVIFVFGVFLTYFIGFVLPTIFAVEEKFICGGILQSQNDCFNHIIKQNDWLICSELHKATGNYVRSDDWGKFPEKETAYKYDGLIRLCGEIP